MGAREREVSGTAVPPPFLLEREEPVIYEDEEVVVVPAMHEDELEREVRRLWEAGVRDAWAIREVLGLRAGIDRIQRILARLWAEERKKRVARA